MKLVTEVMPAGRRALLSGLTIILTATIVSGVVSYVVTWLVPRHIGFADYTIFAVFWASLYLVVGALFGVQQEVTRGTTLLETGAPRQISRARNFGAVAALIVFASIVATAELWVHAVFPVEGWNLVWPLAVGTASYVLVAVLAGSLYGVAAWKPLALMMTTDAGLRLAAIAATLAFTSNVVALAWAAVAPFPVALAVLWPLIRRSIVGRSQLDVGYRALTWNVARTIVAAASAGIMVSGFPLLLGLLSRGAPKAVVGLYILTITLVRAPLIIISMSLQSYFVVTFRDELHGFWKRFLAIEALVIASGIVLAGVGWLLGPFVFGFLFPGQLRPEGWFIAVLVLSSALVGALAISAPAVLARSQHFVYSAGWVASAVVTIAVVALPLDFGLRTVLALVIGPVAGLIVHGTYLIRATTRSAIQ